MLYDPERRWIDRALCQGMTPGLFFAENASQLGRTPFPHVQASWNQAKEICNRCPVLDQCQRDTLGEEFGVWGGKDEHERHLERRKLPRKAKGWAPELRLAWGKELSMLRPRSRPMDWADIRRMTGITQPLAEELIAEWREHRRVQDEQSAAKVVDLPLPEHDVLSFPPGRGDRDMWVRHNGLVASGYYQGETPDGRWIRAQVKTGKGNAIKWVRREDVRFHDPKPVMIIEYLGRPDVPNARAS